MPFKVLRREVEILNVLQTLAELWDMIIKLLFSVSVELAGDCLNNILNGRFVFGTAKAKLVLNTRVREEFIQ